MSEFILPECIDSLESSLSESLEKAGIEAKKVVSELQADLDWIVGDYLDAKSKLQNDLDALKVEAQKYFRSSKFMKSADTATEVYEAEIRTDLKLNHMSRIGAFSSGTEDVLAEGRYPWDYRRAKAVLRQDPEKHLTILRVADQCQIKLERIVLQKDKPELVQTMDGLVEAIEHLNERLENFKEETDPFAIVLEAVW